MKESLLLLSPSELKSLAGAFRSGRLGIPTNPASIGRFLPNTLVDAIAQTVNEMPALGFSAEGIACTLELLAASRAANGNPEDFVELVMSGPQLAGFERRETSVVVSDFFRSANESVLVVGYAIYQGRLVFHELAKRMQELPKLDVRMYLDIARKPGDSSLSAEIVRRYVHRFRSEEWPAGTRVPDIYYDPRALATDRNNRATLHAKCVVVDARRVFISSANFTEAAQERNVEVGVLLHSPVAAARIAQFFYALYESGQFCRALGDESYPVLHRRAD